MRKTFLLSLLFAMLLPLGVSAQEAYAVYTVEEIPLVLDDPSSEYLYVGKLTFYCDDEKYNREGTVYDVQNYGEYPGWYTDHCHDIEWVEFDSSFQMARPRDTRFWFAAENKELSKLWIIDGLEYLDTSMVTDMTGMFMGCKNLYELDLSSFKTSRVTDMSGMFIGCSMLETLYLGENFITSNVYSMQNMFSDCKNLYELDLSCFDTRNVVDMQNMFLRCSRLTVLDLSKWDTSSVRYMGYMFDSCGHLKTIYCGNGWNTEMGPYSAGMFRGCNDLVGGKGTAFDRNHLDAEYAHADGGQNNPGYLTALSEFIPYVSIISDDSYFEEWGKPCLTLVFSSVPYNDYSLPIGDKYGIFEFEEPLVENDLFQNAINSLGYSLSDVKEVCFEEAFSDFYPSSTVWWFDGMEGVNRINGLEHLHTERVRDMSYMFYNCKCLSELDISTLRTDNVKDMAVMFGGCEALSTLDLSEWNTGKVESMSYMFSHCDGLTTIYCGDGWDIKRVWRSEQMFESCTNLVGGMGTIFDSNHVDITYAHVDGGPDNPGYLTYKRAAVPTAIELDDSATGQEEKVYDLQGRRISGITRKGIYIVNGRKVVR